MKVFLLVMAVVVELVVVVVMALVFWSPKERKSIDISVIDERNDIYRCY
jgi:Na+/H+ antiporter NhaA